MTARRALILFLPCLTLLVGVPVARSLLAGSPPSRTPLHRLAQPGPPECVAFSPNSKHLVAGTKGVADRPGDFWDGQLTVWEAESGKQVGTLRLPGWVWSVSFSPKGDLLAAACGSDGQPYKDGYMEFKPRPAEVRLLKFPSLEEVGRINDGILITSVGIADDGKSLAYSGKDKSGGFVKICDLNPLRYRHTVAEVMAPFDFSPDGQVIAIGLRLWQQNGRVKLVNAKTNETKGTLEVPAIRNAITSIRYFPDGRELLLNGGVIWDQEKGAARDTSALMKAIGKTVQSRISASPDGKLLVASTTRRQFTLGEFPEEEDWLVVWDLQPDKLVSQWACTPPRRGRSTAAVAISPDNSLLAVGSNVRTGWGPDGKTEARGGVKLFQLKDK
jgi:WD40 repeat protein